MVELELKNNSRRKTLVDGVEDALLEYFKNNNLKPGDSIPNEMELAESLGVGRAVLREALSRLKVSGMIISRPRIGMMLSEPSLFDGMSKCINPLLMSEKTLLEMLELRMVVEEGICSSIFLNITDEDIAELEEIVGLSQMTGAYTYTSIAEHQFHTKLYQITGNSSIIKFQSIIYPIIEYVKSRYKDAFRPIELELIKSGTMVTHEELLNHIKAGDLEGYRKAVGNHFEIYRTYIKKVRSKNR
ncbi:MAG: FadR family transcriptional regulator [Bacteroidales bacterium]|nr:FadR family transcriptional regulator [Bacteroidales bacterium]